MKTPRALVLLALLFAAVPVSRIGAQVPFTSTSPPNSNPFGSSGSQFGPMQSSRLPATPSAPAGQMGYPSAAPMASSYAGPVDPDHRLGRGDHLSYRVQEDRDDKVWPLIVTDSGEVDVPLLGRVKAVGKSTTQLTSEIKSDLEREYYYHATVIMGLDSVAPQASAGRVFVIHSVHSPGAIDLPVGTSLTVSQAIAQCGGITDFGDARHVKVVRKGGPPKGFIVNVKAVQNGEVDKDMLLQPGDQVVVPEKTFNLSF
jgi:polysaccharide export outer membrane protein